MIQRIQAAAAGLRPQDVGAVKPRLPRDLKAALHDTRPRRIKVRAAETVYGTDTIQLKPARGLKVEALKVRPQFGDLPDEDPHREENGYHAVPAVNLVEAPASYSLLWLPVERRFGTYDAEHTTLMTFRPKLTWTILRGDIERYFAATNSGGDIEDPVLAEYLRPWPTHSIVAGY